MNVVLRLDTEMEAKIRELAEKTGQDPEALILETLKERLLAESGSAMLPRDVWLREFNEMIASMPNGNVNADLSRDSVYKGRGE